MPELELTTTECVCCGNKVREEDLIETVEGDVCEECIEKYGRCSDCDRYFLIESLLYINNSDYICSCCSDVYSRCQDCGTPMSSDYTIRIYNGDQVCEGCIDNEYFFCEDCGEYYPNSMSYDYDLCESCYDDRQMDCNDYDENEFVKSYSYKPSPIFYGNLNERMFGLEIEVKTDWCYAEDFSDKFSYVKEDGSINGFEVVTHPFTLNFEKKNCFLKNLLFSLQKLASVPNSGYGLHIHVNRDSVTPDTIKKLYVFLSSNSDQILQVSGRKSSHLFEWAAIPKYTTYNYCENQGLPYGRHLALNNNPNDTIEFRFFRSSIYFNRVIGCVEFIDSLIKWCSITNVNQLSWNNFLRYLKTKRKKDAIGLIKSRIGE